MSDGAQLIGDKLLEAIFKQLPGRVQRKVTRRAVNLAANPVLNAARAKAPTESGLLKRSLGKKVKTSKEDGTVTATIGPRREVQGQYQGETRKPSRYAHLVENGHLTADGEHVAAKPFLIPAFDQTKGEALDVMSKELGEGIEREAGLA